MSNITIKLNEAGEPDIEFADGVITRDEGLRSAVLISLFTDARVSVDDLPENETDLRGWWGLPEEEEIGSRLWAFGRAAISEMTVEQIREAAEDSLLWLVRSEILENVVVTASRPSRYRVDLCIELIRGSATRFEPQWEATLVDQEIATQEMKVQILKG